MPSQSAKHMTTRPIARVRGSRQALQAEVRHVVLGLLLDSQEPADDERDPDHDQHRGGQHLRGQRDAEVRASRRRPARRRRVPMLKPAWKRGMIERASRRSTSAASTFIETSQLLVPAP